ncbi:GIY-YIG nuclease family protein [Paraferrimonas haliotis]|uniref:UPF0213 protein YhbQ n=1 Tax=Paraferrimonas haliotis TaxID=2013866 RepID=A0AA37WY92_9GAMM|nr:GIY-YIG nuclease family protein [Paraferrimonas haliotis]GLS83480.1 UPF0213 protein YhbQ [Paraferrimonas haliotis]
MSEYYLYLIRRNDGALYTGITTDVKRRFNEHCHTPLAAKALKGRGPLRLEFSQAVGDRSRASKLEYQVKKLSKKQKLALISGALSLSSLLSSE